jgi:hypothetical protein
MHRIEGGMKNPVLAIRSFLGRLGGAICGKCYLLDDKGSP